MDIRRIETPEDDPATLIEKLADAREEINNLREEIDEISHEDEVVIITKHKIGNIEIYFEKGEKR